MMLYQMSYESLYLELRERLKLELGIELPEDWERRVCSGERGVPLINPAFMTISTSRLQYASSKEPPAYIAELEPIGEIKFRNADEMHLWIEVYSRNSDNDEESSDQLARWADTAIYEMRKRYAEDV